MTGVHKCALPVVDTSGLKKLAPNASLWSRSIRRLHRLILVNPNNFGCKSFFQNRPAVMAEQRRHIRNTYYYMIHPFSTLSSVLQVTFFVLWTFKLFSEPFFGTVFNKPKLFADIDKFFILHVQTIVIVAFCFMGYVDEDAREIVIDHRKVILKYLKTYFVFDVIAVETFRKFVSYLLAKNPNTNFTWRMENVVDYCHVVCLYARLNSIMDHLDAIGQMLGVKLKVRRCICYVVKTFLLLHLFCSLIYFVSGVTYYNDWPEDSWFVLAGIKPEPHLSRFKLYGECLLMATCYFFGASAGKYPVHQFSEQVVLTWVSLFGRLYTLYLVADILRMFGVVSVAESSYERKLAQLREYMVSNDLPRPLRNRMVRYYEHKLQKRYFNEPQILNTISDSLRAEIFLFSASNLMQMSNVFKYLSQSDIATLVSLMRRETFAPGDVLFKPDQPREDIFLICSGTIAILNRDKLEMCHMEDGDVIGLLLRTYGNSDYYAIVLETTDLFLINTEVFYRFLTPYPQALDYLRVMIKERFEGYKALEDMAIRRANTVAVELKHGRILEKRRRRKVIAM